jgi:hypothetical protein
LPAFFFQIEKPGVRRQKNIARHLAQLGETSLVVGVEDHLIRFTVIGNISLMLSNLPMPFGDTDGLLCALGCDETLSQWRVGGFAAIQ